MKINRGDEETTITHHWLAPEVNAECKITKTGGDNADARFYLKIEGGQVSENSIIEMCGPWERQEFVNLLKQIVIEIELLDEK